MFNFNKPLLAFIILITIIYSSMIINFHKEKFYPGWSRHENYNRHQNCNGHENYNRHQNHNRKWKRTWWDRWWKQPWYYRSDFPSQ